MSTALAILQGGPHDGVRFRLGLPGNDFWTLVTLDVISDQHTNENSPLHHRYCTPGPVNAIETEIRFEYCGLLPLGYPPEPSDA